MTPFWIIAIGGSILYALCIVLFYALMKKSAVEEPEPWPDSLLTPYDEAKTLLEKEATWRTR